MKQLHVLVSIKCLSQQKAIKLSLQYADGLTSHTLLSCYNCKDSRRGFGFILATATVGLFKRDIKKVDQIVASCRNVII